MIRKLTEQDRENVLNYLYQEPSINIFIIGDIENFGFNVDFQDVYADFTDDTINNVLLRYKENVIYYCHEDYFNEEFLEIIHQIDYQFISAKGSLMELIKPHFSTMNEKPMYFCEANTFNDSIPYTSDKVKRLSTASEARKVFHLLKGIQEFDSFKNQTEEDFVLSKLRSIQTSVCLLIEEDDKAVSTVATVADTKKAAMVVAVATDPNYRKKGYASDLMMTLMDMYLNQRNKYLCLFYDNPEAGKIYHRLGFTDIDKWVMLVRK